MPINCEEQFLHFGSIRPNMAPSVSETITQTAEHAASGVGKLNLKEEKIVDVRRKFKSLERNRD